MNELRPNKFDKIVGNQKIITRLRQICHACRKRGEPLPHILFDGPPGVGKTTLARAIANEMNVPIVECNGASVRTVKSAMTWILKVRKNCIFFIDEIHRLPRLVEEMLYPVMEDFRLDIVNPKECEAFSIKLDPFTLIGATTESGALSEPLWQRFYTSEVLDIYSHGELITIIKHSAKILNLKLNHDAVSLIARASRGTPRLANNLLRWVRDFTVDKKQPITLKMVEEALTLKDISLVKGKVGMTKNDLRYLFILKEGFCGGPVSLETMSNATQMSVITLKKVIEPFLIRQNKIRITNKGRVLINT